MIEYRAPRSAAASLQPYLVALNKLLGRKSRYTYTVDVRHVSETRIRQLNRRHRQQDRPTDVLSFPLFSTVSELPEHDAPLGDVMVAPAMTGGQHLDLTECYLHGTLHLLGYDHDQNSKAWRHAYDTIHSAQA